MYKANKLKAEKPSNRVNEKTGKREKNPFQITNNQHVIPKAHLRRWEDAEGYIHVADKEGVKNIKTKPEKAFLVKRLWDQQTEEYVLKGNEENYQKQIIMILKDQIVGNHRHISAYYSMLCIRSELANKSRPTMELLMGNINRPPLGKLELEEIEREGVGSGVTLLYPGAEESQALSRGIAAMAISMKFSRCPFLYGERERIWRLLYASEGDRFVMPDSLCRLRDANVHILPLSHRKVLIEDCTYERLVLNGEMCFSSINKYLQESAYRYYVI